MQGNFDLILRGKKKDIERFREVSGIINLPELPVHNIRELTLSGESFSENYEDAVEDDIVGYSFESSASHNINGEDKWAEEVSKAFPELELLMYFTYLDYEESGDAVYSAPGSPKCTQLSWTHNERHEDPGDMDEDEIETKLQEYRDQGLACGTFVDGTIYVLEGHNWDRNSGPKVPEETLNELLEKKGFDIGTSRRRMAQWRREEEEWRRKEEERLRKRQKEIEEEVNLYKPLCQETAVQVQGSAFMLEGSFARCDGVKKNIKELITARGGRISKSLSGKTKYFVLGSQGGYSEERIEKAKLFREKGLMFISEDTLFIFLD